MAIEKLTLPVGRMVWGSATKSQIKKNYTTKQPVLKDGKTVDTWAFGIAIERNKFYNEIFPMLQAEVARLYPQGTHPDFSWKLTDGDTAIDDKGRPYREREGYAGHVVINISTEAFAPDIYKFENGAYRKLEAHECKTGDYYAVNVNIKAHNENKGGLYFNPNMLELVGYGTEIVGRGADPMEAFGGKQHQLPAGASAVPLSSAPAAMQPQQMPQQGFGMPPQQPQQMPQQGFGMQPQQPQQMPQQGFGMPPQQPQQLPPPAHDFVNNAGNYQPAPSAVGQTAMQQPYAGGAMTYPMNGMPPART